MSDEPPASGRPTGPPSGPLSPSGGGSGPSSSGPRPTEPAEPPGPPPPPPPSSGGPSPGGPPGSGGGARRGPSGEGGGEGGGPWWRSVPRVAVVAALVVGAVIVAVVLSRPDGGSEAGGEVFLQAAGSSGPDPFTGSTAKDSSMPPATPAPPTGPSAKNAVRDVDGGTAGLYGGTRKTASCDVARQIKALGAQPAKNKAFASVAGVAASGVPGHLRALTPVQLRMDTRVTNHGYRAGAATAYQAVLQAGTAVLVDDRGRPRVRCACGNPLTPPVAQQGSVRRTGKPWPSFDPAAVVAVSPAKRPVKSFVVYDAEHGTWFTRPRGDTGTKDRTTTPPSGRPTPSGGDTEPPSPDTPGDGTTPPGDDTPAPESPGTRPESPGDQTPEEPPPSPGQTPPDSEPAPGTPPQSAPPPGGQPRDGEET